MVEALLASISDTPGEKRSEEAPTRCRSAMGVSRFSGAVNEIRRWQSSKTRSSLDVVARCYSM